MIRGKVNAQREAVVPLLLISNDGDQRQMDAVVDTGFNGSLTLPPYIVTSLMLEWQARSVGEMADGTLIENDAYLATVMWLGERREVVATQIEGPPLIGMKLLYGHELRVEAIADGDVTIAPLE